MKIVIIGNGISGVTAARFIRKLSDHKIILISDESPYFFSRPALMYIYMGHMKLEHTQPYEKNFWKKNKIDLLHAKVSSIDVRKKLVYTNEKTISYDKLIIACGSKPNKFGWPGQDLKNVHGLYSLQNLKSIEEASPRISHSVIVGGGLIGIEMAEMFISRKKSVTMLVREKSYWDIILPPDESAMINNVIRAHGVDLQLETELKEIQGNSNDEVVRVKTNKGDLINCQFVGLTAGVSPNIGWLKGSDIDMKKGILVNKFLETNVSDVYAIGDCAEQMNPKSGRRPIEAVWYTGKMMGETVAHTICSKPTEYDPGIWFNSAKFFDIEYQVYGAVPSILPPDQSSFFWLSEDGEKSVRIVFDKKTETVLGFNLMGIRFRHEVCEKWIYDKSTIEKVLENLSLASFDPEFYQDYSKNLIRKYNMQKATSLTAKSSRRLDGVSKFLRS